MYTLEKEIDLGIIKYKHEIEAFDYHPEAYIDAPKNFLELAELDKKLFNEILARTNHNLYVVEFCVYCKDGDNQHAMKYKLWNERARPNDDPQNDFKYEVNYNKRLSEYFTDGENYYIYSGIAEITLDFYVSNYLYFNSFNCAMLLLSDDVETANLKIKSIVDGLVNSNESYKFTDIILQEFLHKNDKDIIIKTNDTGEYKTMEICMNELCLHDDMIKTLLSGDDLNK